ncbi:MAG: methionine--tRNA ligase [Candidatus Woesearchaeota archaeon]
MPKILVTSALPYANGPIHIGHLVEYIQTDIFVRFLKLKGEDVIFCCADDAHGTPIEINARKIGITPKELIDSCYKEHVEDFKTFLVEFDSYHTTDSEENKKYCELIYSRLKEKGLIEKKSISQLYCESCKRFLPDRYIRGKCPKCGAEDQYGDQCERCGRVLQPTELIEPKCSICGCKPIKKESMHYFFLLSKCQDKLKNWLLNNRKLQPEIRNYVMNWIDEGLQDWDISRDGPYFGFLIPGEKDKYFYVWLDAPIGYIASTENYCKKHGRKTEDYWKGRDSRIMHFIGKDIAYFHFLFWPAMLMESGFNLPDEIVVHGYLTVNGEKMSKSRGTFFTAKDFAKIYNPEYLRYYYASMLSRKLSDIDLSFDDFTAKVNNELVANIGNFCYRVQSFVNKNFDNRIAGIDLDEDIINSIKAKMSIIEQDYENLDLKGAVREIMAISSIGNKYFQDNKPWQLLKENKQDCEEVLGLCLSIMKNLSIVASPIMPKFSRELQEQIGISAGWKDLGFENCEFRIKEAGILIEKIANQQEIFPADLRAAKVLNAEDHPTADKLTVMQIDLGYEKRQIVAGIRQYYNNEELVGKAIVVVANLKSAKLRGIESRGMLLAADDGHAVRLVNADGIKPGDQIVPEGMQAASEQITIEEFSRLGLTAKNKTISYKGKLLSAAGKKALADVQDGAVIR